MGIQEDLEEFSSPEEIRFWSSREIANMAKEVALRTKEATDLTEAYSRGDITREEAEARFYRYKERWDEPLFGFSASDFDTDEKLVARIDKERAEELACHGEDVTRRELERRLNRFEGLFGRLSEGSKGR